MNFTPESEPQMPRRSRSSRKLAGVLIVVIIAVGGVAVGAYTRHSDPTLTTVAGNEPQQLQATAADHTTDDVKALQQSVKDVQNSQQQISDQVEKIQRDLASEQGERKLLSDQLGSLAGGVDELSSRLDALSSHAQITTEAAPRSPRKKPSAR